MSSTGHDAWDDLHSAFDRGFTDGEASLTAPDHDLYLIMGFVIEFEIGGWLYNWAPHPERFGVTAAAMRRRGLEPLADLVSEAGRILGPIEQTAPDLLWRDILQLLDPGKRLKAVEAEIRGLPDYGIPKRW